MVINVIGTRRTEDQQRIMVNKQTHQTHHHSSRRTRLHHSTRFAWSSLSDGG